MINYKFIDYVKLDAMSLSELETERGYIAGAGSRLREKMGLKSVDDAEQHRRIIARVRFEESNFRPIAGVRADEVNNPQPKAKWKGAK